MKRNEVLFLAIGGLESARLEATEVESKGSRHSKPRFLLVAALIALTLLLVGCAVAVYAKIHTQVTQYDVPTATVSTDSGVETKNVLTDCYPQALPNGYRMVGGSPIDRTTQSIEFANDAGQTINYIISTAERDGITPASAESSEVTVSGQSGTMQVSDEGQTIAWHNETDGYYAWLDTEDMTVNLQAMADSVAFGQRLPLSFLCKDGAIWDPHYPQQLPDGYTVKQVSFASDVVIIDYGSEGEAITYVVSPTYDLRDTVSDPPHDSFVWTDETVGEDAARMLTTSGGLRELLWENTREGFYAMLFTMDENVDILAMAESTAAGEPLSETPVYLGPDYSIDLSQDSGTYYGWESIYPQSTPEGYRITFISDRAYGQQEIRYENAAGNILRYTFYYRLGPYGRSFDGAGQPETVDINGNTGYLNGGSLLWTDETKGYAYTLATDDNLDLVAIARSVGLGPELTPTNASKATEALEELGDYRITALPAGMEEDSFTGWPLENGWYAYVRRWYFDKETGKELFFSYETYVSDGTVTLEELAQMNIGSSEPTQAYTIQGCPAAGAVVGELAPSSEVVWIQGTQEKGLCFLLSSADYTVEELVQIAESVRKQ
ncbi:MAG: hypothetical protein SOZ90_02685 [Candidatus Faecousia sp.]|nr:hypothetical protein [Candidatus Faecousia sp.]